MGVDMSICRYCDERECCSILRVAKAGCTILLVAKAICESSLLYAVGKIVAVTVVGCDVQERVQV